MFSKEPKACRECGELFQPFSGDSYYCGKICRRNFNRRRFEEVGIVFRVCPTCGTSFRPSGKKKYCKLSCRPPKTKIAQHGNCVYCGVEFVKKSSKHKFCSAKCAYRLSYGDALPARPCTVCGEDYVPRVDYQKYCSERCRYDRALAILHKKRAEAKDL